MQAPPDNQFCSNLLLATKPQHLGSFNSLLANAWGANALQQKRKSKSN